MVHALFEAALVNYVVSGSLPSTTHSRDATLMRFVLSRDGFVQVPRRWSCRNPCRCRHWERSTECRREGRLAPPSCHHRASALRAGWGHCPSPLKLMLLISTATRVGYSCSAGGRMDDLRHFPHAPRDQRAEKIWQEELCRERLSLRSS
jgi:hypothetical protein